MTNSYLCVNISKHKKIRGGKMKEGLHPDYHEVTVNCACGNSFKTGSTVSGDSIKIDICNKCHPFFSGKQKLVDTSGRVEKFKKKFNV